MEVVLAERNFSNTSIGSVGAEEEWYGDYTLEPLIAHELPPLW